MNASAPILRTSREFPADWPVRTAASFAPFITSGSRGWAKYYSATGDLFMRITNLDRSSIYPDLSDRQHVSLPEAEREGLRTGLKAGDILISITADIGIIGYVDERIPFPAYINQHVACLRLPQDQVWPKFVAYYLASAEPQRRFVEMTDIGAKTGINLTTVGKLTFPCPPLAEQQAIAAALSDADGVVAGLERVIAKKRLIKQGAMQDLLTARRRLPGFSGEWGITSLGSALRRSPSYGINAPAIPRGTGGFAYLRITDISNDGTVDPSGLPSVRESASDQYLLAEGDIVVARTGASVGKSHLFRDIGEPVIFAGFLIRLCPDETKLLPSFLSQFMQTQNYWDWVRENSARSGQPGVNGQQLRTILLKLPEIEEQQAIAAVLSDMDAEVQTLEFRHAKARAVKEGMMQNLLTGRVRLV